MASQLGCLITKILSFRRWSPPSRWCWKAVRSANALISISMQATKALPKHSVKCLWTVEIIIPSHLIPILIFRMLFLVMSLLTKTWKMISFLPAISIGRILYALRRESEYCQPRQIQEGEDQEWFSVVSGGMFGILRIQVKQVIIKSDIKQEKKKNLLYKYIYVMQIGNFHWGMGMGITIQYKSLEASVLLGN